MIKKILLYILSILLLTSFYLIAAENQENSRQLGRRLLEILMHSEDLDRHGGCMTQEMADDEVKYNALRLLDAHRAIDVNIEDGEYGWTSLLVALDRNFFEIANLLLNRGANIEVRGRAKLTPLMYACIWNNLPFLVRLINLGADVNALDKDEETALMHTRNLEIAKLLIQNGASINHTNIRGHTVLSYFKKEEERLELIKISKECSIPRHEQKKNPRK
jgi:ankyrin repeat protein